jgi:DNA polymerase sigma
MQTHVLLTDIACKFAQISPISAFRDNCGMVFTSVDHEIILPGGKSQLCILVSLVIERDTIALTLHCAFENSIM